MAKIEPLKNVILERYPHIARKKLSILQRIGYEINLFKNHDIFVTDRISSMPIYRNLRWKCILLQKIDKRLLADLKKQFIFSTTSNVAILTTFNLDIRRLWV